VTQVLRDALYRSAIVFWPGAGAIPGHPIARMGIQTIFFEVLTMTFQQIKTAVLSISGITREWVRSNFGDLRLKSTWQAAYDRCFEFAAAAVEVATSDRAMVIYEVVFSLVAIITIVLFRQVSALAIIAYAYSRDKAMAWGKAVRCQVGLEFENLVNLATVSAY
jgi:hypothetical protein